ncbi:hypothetical protein QQ045_007071 [Rhodiola kirilowii]
MMIGKFLCWNARGIMNIGTIDYLKSIMAQHQIDLCVILEPMSNSDQLANLALKLKFGHSLHCSPSNTHIWLLWNDNVRVTEVTHSSQHITVSVYIVPTDNDILCSFVYGSLDSNTRRELWDDLNMVAANYDKPWLICGDFNALLSWKEKKGRNNKKGRSIREFNEFLASAGVNDAGFKGNSYTWSNNQEGEGEIWERLDRCLVNGLTMSEYPNLEVQHLARIYSDHYPLLLNLNGAGSRRKSTFRFLGAWTDHANFHEIVKNTWIEKAHKNPLLNLALKLKKLRGVLRKWNWDIFGDVNRKVKHLTQRVLEMEDARQQGINNTTKDAVTKIKEELSLFLRYQYAILEEKSKHKWIMEGDRNSAFFHASIKARRVNNNMKLRMDDGTFSEDAKTIGNHAVTSTIWSAIKPFILKLRRDSFWEIGRGDILLSHFSEWFGVRLPKVARDWTIKEVISDNDIKSKFLLMPTSDLHSAVCNTIISDSPDKLV